jgi:radical SAM superfamily enzyme YgiQ (UPF0313 family)
MEPYKVKIVLGLLPFWTPLIPPLGISGLKSFLQRHGCDVKVVDANIEGRFKGIYDKYFFTLDECIPGKKKGNLYNIGHDLLESHMMAHLHCENEEEYIKLLEMLIFKNFFCRVDKQYLERLKKIVSEFYVELGEYVLELLEKEKPAILGLSVFRSTFAASLFAFKLTRDKYPHIKTVMGGGIFSQELELGSQNFKHFLKEVSYIDKIIVGEGENIFLKFLRDQLPREQRIYSLEDIDNEALDLESVDVPDFSDFDTRHYVNLAAYASRSCPFQCSFCAETTYWGRYRKKSPGKVARELITLFKEYDRQLFLMCDSLLNPIITGLALELLKTNISLFWDGYLRVDNDACDVEKTMLWRRGGFYRARIGIESGSSRVLRRMGKKITPGQIKKAISGLAEAGIKTTTYWVVGHPGETEEDFMQTLDLIEELNDDIYEAECNPFRYFETGQVNSDKWAKKIKKIPLYPEHAKNLLITQTWTLDCEPSRETAFKRLCRFEEHCRHIGVPNPYSLKDIYSADERWKKLHKSAVPPLLELNSGGIYIEDKKYVEKLLSLENKFEENGDFSF